jgi:glycosyltransferase involved in cell wall biosynthesis
MPCSMHRIGDNAATMNASSTTPVGFPKIDLSVIIIAYNEAANIEACIASVPFAAQVVVLDGGSTDSSEQLARNAGAEVTVHAVWEGFGLQKNRALNLATHKWVLALDADERVTPELAQEIINVVARNEPVVAELARLTQFCGQWIRHCGWYPDRVSRLWMRGSCQFSNDLVHERLVTQNLPLVRLSSHLLHYSYPTPAAYWDKLSRYSQAWALQRYTQGAQTSMARAAASGFVAFLRSYIFRLGFLDGAMGFAVCLMQAQAAFGKYFTLYCLQRQSPTYPKIK